jgi:phage-related minor tail protein
MAIINKTGITNGGTIQAEHITRVIDALSGVSTDTLILSGSMTGSLIGTLTGTASFATSASSAVTAVTASHALNVGESTEYITIRLSHGKQIGVVDTTLSYFGPNSMSTKSSVSQSGAVLPFNCQIISASFYTAVDVLGSVSTRYTIIHDVTGTPTDITTPIVLDLSSDFDVSFISVASTTLTAGDVVNIEMLEVGTDASVEFTSAVDLFIKKV